MDTEKKPWEFFDEEIFPHLSFEALFGDLEGLRQDGRFWQACCPVHKGSSGELCIDPDTLEWNCFVGCGGGGPVQYLQSLRGLSWSEAARDLAHAAGLESDSLEVWLDSWTQADFELHGQLERRSSLLGLLMAYTRSILRSDAGRTLRGDLNRRYGFSEEALERFGLGLYSAPEDLWHYLKKTGRPMEEVRSWGLFDSKWSGCLLAGWKDLHGRHVNLWGWHPSRAHGTAAGHGGQLLFEESGPLPGKAVPFNLDGAARERKFALLLVPEPLDVVFLSGLGLEDPCPVSAGGDLTRSQIHAIERHLSLSGELTLCLDYDRKLEGTKLDRTRRTLERLRSARFPVYFVPPALMTQAGGRERRVPVAGFILRNGGGPPALQAFQSLLGQRECQAVPEGAPVEEGHNWGGVFQALQTLSGRGSHPGRVEAADMRTPHFWEPIFRIADEVGKRLAGGFLSALPQSLVRGLAEGESESMRREPSSRALPEGLPAAPFSARRLEEQTLEIPLDRSSGWNAVDALGTVFRAGELAVVAGRLAHGKTSVLLGLLLEWLERAEQDEGDELFIFCSTGEAEVRLYHRLLSLLAAKEGQGFTVRQVESHLREFAERQKEFDWSNMVSLAAARRKFQKWESRLQLSYHPDGRLEGIEDQLRHWSSAGRIGGVFVDHVQALPSREIPGGSGAELSATARRLKSLAVEFSCPLVVSAQLGRLMPSHGSGIPLEKAFGSPEVRQAIRRRRPQIHDLKESGIAQEADLVLGLLNHLTDFQTERGESGDLNAPSPLEVGVLKSRHGEAGRWAMLMFEPQFGRVREADSTEAAA